MAGAGGKLPTIQPGPTWFKVLSSGSNEDDESTGACRVGFRETV